eukprot:2265320-Rhodomonas_salina.2
MDTPARIFESRGLTDRPGRWCHSAHLCRQRCGTSLRPRAGWAGWPLSQPRRASMALRPGRWV